MFISLSSAPQAVGFGDIPRRHHCPKRNSIPLILIDIAASRDHNCIGAAGLARVGGGRIGVVQDLYRWPITY